MRMKDFISGHTIALETTIENPNIIKEKNRYLIKDKNKIISKIGFTDYSKDIKGFNWILLYNIDTDPDYRGQGLCTKLLNEISNDIDTNKGLYLCVRTDNDTAISVYKKNGFKVLKKTSIANGSNTAHDFYVMYKGNGNIKKLNSVNFG